jgi:hypothetical protein
MPRVYPSGKHAGFVMSLRKFELETVLDSFITTNEKKQGIKQKNCCSQKESSSLYAIKPGI